MIHFTNIWHNISAEHLRKSQIVSCSQLYEATQSDASRQNNHVFDTLNKKTLRQMGKTTWSKCQDYDCKQHILLTSLAFHLVTCQLEITKICRKWYITYMPHNIYVNVSIVQKFWQGDWPGNYICIKILRAVF